MQIYSQKSEYTLLQGNMLDMGDFVGGGTIDSIVTDPPYELNFMGKGWDNSGIAFQPDTWKRCLEALKPGGYLLAFGGSRTYHRIACAIEDAGFEIRDCIMWLYGSGFPKSMNIGLAIDKKNGVESEVVGTRTEYDIRNNNYANNDVSNKTFERDIKKATNERAGWGTALKPSYEPIIVARKPLEGSCTDNVIKYGVGGINIDECRVAFNGDKWNPQKSGANSRAYQSEETTTAGGLCEANDNGRFPANTILTYDESDFEEVCGGFPNTKSTYNKDNKHESVIHRENADTLKYGYKTRIDSSSYNDEGSASRYFYCAKASKRDRDEGLQEFETKSHAEINNRKEGSAGAERAYGGGTNPYLSVSSPRKNIHPTVKPTNLMQYLIRLVTPKGGIVLDPFNGSGSTGKAVMYENKDRNKNYKYIGIELTEEYLPIAKARIEYAINRGTEKEKSDPKQEDQNKERKESALF